jgi:hypothetical protein
MLRILLQLGDKVIELLLTLGTVGERTALKVGIVPLAKAQDNNSGTSQRQTRVQLTNPEEDVKWPSTMQVK